MRKVPLFALAAGFAAMLPAYGVSPSQYQAGQAQDARVNNGFPQAPMPQGLPPGAISQPGNLPQPPIDYNAVATPDWAKAWKHYRWDEAKALWDSKKALFCDARAKSEYDQGHIPGAIPLPLGEFDKYYALYKDRIKHAKQLVTYCHGAGCQLSNKVAQKLWVDKKFRNVGSFFGGWPQWQEHNMPVETGGVPKPR